MIFIFKTIFFGMLVSLLTISFTWLVSLTVLASLHIFKYDLSPTVVWAVALLNIAIGTIIFIVWIIYLFVQAHKGYKMVLKQEFNKGDEVKE